MPRIAVQYLENGPGIEDINPREARAKLRAAFALLPIDDILLGWNLPSDLVEVCREVATEAGANLFLWHPFLSGDGVFVPRQEWQTVGLRGESVPGFRQMPEFTFVCPNRPAVRDAVLAHLQISMRGSYDGVFLDRMRFPAPAADPSRWLACFCEECRRAASAEGLDLVAARKGIRRLLNSKSGVRSFLHILLGKGLAGSTDPDINLLTRFLDFRIRSINRLVIAAADLIHAAGLQVALDCFAPSLTRMVGQDLEALEPWCDWSKIMVYGHAFGPAGLPFELTELARWLIETSSLDESVALAWLSEATGLRLPNSLPGLRQHGLPSASLEIEYGKAPNLGAGRLAVGIELVEIAGITELDTAQIRADLHAFRNAGADSLVLSWDLWHMSLDRLQLVRDVWVTEAGPSS